MLTVLVAAIVSGSIYALVSLGFAIAFRVSGVFNFTHGGLLITAAYLDYFFWTSGIPGWLAFASALFCATCLGFAIEAVLIPRGKRYGLTSLDFLVVSWLMLLVIQNVLAIAFSNASIYLGTYEIKTGWQVWGAGITTLQILIIAVSVVTGVLLFVFSKYFATGREIIAVGDDSRLAGICGVNVRKVIRVNALLAASLTAGAGVLLVYQERLDPSLGMRFSIIAIVSTLAGFRFGPAGAVVGGFALAFLESFVLYLVDPALRNLAVYICLFVIVLLTFRRSAIPRE